MNIAKAINRLVWRMTNSKFTPNQNDQDSVNFLVEWINQEKQKTKDKNALFIKIFVFALRSEFNYWQDIQQAQRVLIEQLEKPIDFHYNRMHDALNTVELEKFKKEIGYYNVNSHFRTDKQNEQNKHLIEKHKDKFVRLQNQTEITQDEVYNSLNNLLTEIINKYKNLP